MPHGLVRDAQECRPNDHREESHSRTTAGNIRMLILIGAAVGLVTPAGDTCR
jgi:hypothetical protein